MSKKRGKRGGKVHRSAAEMALLRAESDAVRVQAMHGHRPDLTLKRESRTAERIGARARLGDGMTLRDIDRVQAERDVLQTRGQLGLLAYRATCAARDSADAIAADVMTINNNREASDNDGN